MARKWPVDGNNSERLPEGIVIQGYDADTRIYYYRSLIDGTRYRSEPGVKFGRLILLEDKSLQGAREEPVLVRDSWGRKHTATPYRMPSAAGSASRPRAVTFNDTFTPRSQGSWDYKSPTVVDEDSDDDEDDRYSFVEEKGSFTIGNGGGEGKIPLTSGLRRAHTTSEVRSSAGKVGVGKKVGKLARALSKRIVGGSGAPRRTVEEEQGGQAMRYDPAKAVGRRRAATTFDDILSAAPPVERKR